MIRLDTLVALGQREKLGYLLEDQRPYGEVVLDDDGRIVTIRKSSGAILVPDLPNRTNAELRIGLFVENEMYLFGTTAKSYKDDEKPRKALEHAAEAYAKIAREVRIKATRAVSRFYDLSLKGKHKVPKEWQRFQRYVFVHKDRHLPGIPQLRPVIQRFVDALPEVDSIKRQCLITGEWVHCQTTPHANTKGLSSNSSGSSLVSFNGTSQYEGPSERRFLTAPIAPGVSRLMSSALSWLSRNRKIPLTPDLNILVWAEQGHPLEELAPRLFAGAYESEEQRGERGEALDELLSHPEWEDSAEGAYLLTVNGNMGRLAVREWEETTVGALYANLRRFVEDFTVEIVVAGEEIQARHMSLSRLYTAWSDKQIVHREILDLANMALKGTAVPEWLLLSGASENIAREATVIQKAICQAYGKRNMENPGNFSADLSVEGQSDAYRVGRACAVMEVVRYRANRANSAGVIAHSVVDNPSVGFHRAMQSIIHHLPKRQGNQYTVSLSVFAGEITIPLRFAVQEQAEFWQGYLYEQGRQSWLSLLASGGDSDESGDESGDGEDSDEGQKEVGARDLLNG